VRRHRGAAGVVCGAEGVLPVLWAAQEGGGGGPDRPRRSAPHDVSLPAAVVSTPVACCDDYLLRAAIRPGLDCARCDVLAQLDMRPSM
jgi:hypothetical protein